MNSRPLKAIVLASGMGKRMGPYATGIPKALIKVGGLTLLERQINTLRECGIEDLVITTGYEREKIHEFVSEAFPDLNVTYVFNERYETTNYIYTLWVAREHLNSEVLLLHSDLFFDPKVLHRLLDFQGDSAVTVSRKRGPSKDFRANIHNGRVHKIAVDLPVANSVTCLPLYKLEQTVCDAWVKAIESFVSKREVNCYAEDALNTILPLHEVYACYISDMVCIEIDTYEDLTLAKRLA